MVDAVNNNRDAVYTGIGAGVGAVAGGAYGGWLSKPLLKGDAPSDAFVKRYYDNSAKDAAEAAKKAFKESFGEKEVNDLKNELKKNPKKYGIEFASDATEDTKNAKIDEYAKGLDENGLFAKMEKAVAENANVDKKSGKELTKLKNAFAKVEDGLDDAKAQEFAKKHTEILGISADDAGEIKAADLKTKVKSVTLQLEGAKDLILEHFDVKEGMKKLADNADESTKSAFEAVKKAAKDTKLWAGAKWAAIGAAVIGVCSYIGAKMTAPKAPAETPSENA